MKVLKKKHIYFIFTFIAFYPAHAQVVAIQNYSNNILYLCWYNKIKVAVENVASEKIILTTDNGKITKEEYDEKGGYRIMPDHVGSVEIYVKRKTSKGVRTIDSVRFYARRIPLSSPRLAGGNEGKITKSDMCMQIAPKAYIYMNGIDGAFIINNFTVVVTRRNREIFRRINSEETGTRIDSTTHAFFQSLHNKDRVLFMDIATRDCDGTTRYLDPMEFTITDAEKYHKPPKHGHEVLIDPADGHTTTKDW